MLTIKESTKTTTDPNNINIDVEYEGANFNISTSPINEELSDIFSKEMVLLDIRRDGLDRITYSPKKKKDIIEGDNLIDIVRSLCDSYNNEVSQIIDLESRKHGVTSRELKEKGLV